MGRSAYRRGALGVGLGVALLAGCGGVSRTTGAMPQRVTSGTFRDGASAQPLGAGYKVLYRFKGFPYDGANPFAGLTDLQGTLYGTTPYGSGPVPPGGKAQAQHPT